MFTTGIARIVRCTSVASIAALSSAIALAIPIGASAQTIAPSPAPSAAVTPAPDICSSGLSSVVSRPTQTTSACSVKTNQVLIETGFQTQTVDAGTASFTSTSVPNATLRFGTPLRNVEFDIIPPTALHAGGTGATSDAGVGARWQIGSTPLFAYSVNAIATVATGSNPAANAYGLGSAKAGTFILNANVQGALSSIFGYGATAEVAELNAGGVHYTSYVPSLDVTASLPASFGIALEAYRQTNGEGPATPAHTWFDAALTKDAGNAQFDLNYGIATRIVPAPGVPSVGRHYAGFGISYLF
jgi:hypothetical protein